MKENEKQIAKKEPNNFAEEAATSTRPRVSLPSPSRLSKKQLKGTDKTGGKHPSEAVIFLNPQILLVLMKLRRDWTVFLQISLFLFLLSIRLAHRLSIVQVKYFSL